MALAALVALLALVAAAAGAPTPIETLQSERFVSPLAGTRVAEVAGITTFVVSASVFFVQTPDEDPLRDDDDRTSAGIRVFLQDPDVPDGVGAGCAAVLRNCTLQERRFDDTELTVTELYCASEDSSAEFGACDLAVPAPVVLGDGGRAVPTDQIRTVPLTMEADMDDEEIANLDTDVLDFLESLEGMRVVVHDAVAVSPLNEFGEVWVLADAGAGFVRSPRGALPLLPNRNYNPGKIRVQIPAADRDREIVVGDKFLVPLVGVVDYEFGDYTVFLEDGPAATDIESGGPEPTVRKASASAPPRDRLSVATFNVENFGASEPVDRLVILTEHIADNLKLPDIIAIQEFLDDDGPGGDGLVTDCSVGLYRLTGSIQEYTGVEYEFRQIDPTPNADGGIPGGNIRVVFLFRADRVGMPASNGQGDAITPVGIELEADSRLPHLTLNPGRIDPKNPVFDDLRKSLAGEFVFNGRTVFVINNHLKSRRGDTGIMGRYQPSRLLSEGVRLAEVQVLLEFTDELLAADPDANIIFLGDMNEFYFGTPLLAPLVRGFDNLMGSLAEELDRYSFNFQGNSQAIDHIFVSDALRRASPTITPMHINTEYGPRGGSDHDPVVAVFTLAEKEDTDRVLIIVLASSIAGFLVLAAAIWYCKRRSKGTDYQRPAYERA